MATLAPSGTIVLEMGLTGFDPQQPSSDAAIEGLRSAIAATVPENIRWDSFRQMLKDNGYSAQNPHYSRLNLDEDPSRSLRGSAREFFF